MSDVLWLMWSLAAVGAAAFALANRSAPREVARERWIKFAVYIAVVHLVIASAVWGREAAAALVTGIVAVGLAELRRAVRGESQRVGLAVSAVFALAGVGAVVFAWRASASQFIFLYLVVVIFDGFSQAGGQIAGRTRLAPGLSPGKTREGSLIGAAFAVAGACALRDFSGISAASAVLAGLGLSGSGLVGDLAASWVKRRAGVKDFGRLLPGHGGVLDRFDSVVAAAAVAVFWT